MPGSLRALLAVVGALAALLAAACEDPCKSCRGCCDEGVCLPGTAPGACGIAGVSCAACGSGRTCAAGSCVDAPDAGPRDGGGSTLCACATGCCRADGGCAAGNLPDQCGTSGRYCAICSPGQVCPRGVCENPVSCSGCVDALGVCRTGLTAGTCGRGGVPCRACIGTDTCDAGTCMGNSACNAVNCPGGCCASTNICVPPTSTQCGTRGGACVICPDGGACVGGTCQ